MDGKNVVDVSSFLLFEGTGDSEADCDLNMEAVNKEMEGGDDDVDDDDDDAQSCSYDSCDCTRVMEFDSYDEEDDPHNEDWAGDDDDDDDDPAGLVKLGGPKKKSSVCVESAMEFMSEMEKNRLFWETCLAS